MNRAHQFVLLVIIFFSGPLLSVAEAATHSQLIIAGKSIGRVKLGMHRSDVQNALGKPSLTHRDADGYIQDSWLRNPNTLEESYFVRVVYLNNKVMQIECTSPRFHTHSGICTSTHLKIIRHRVRSMKSTLWFNTAAHYHISIPTLSIYDSKTLGIAFTQRSVDGEYLPDSGLQSIIVHVPGRTVKEIENMMWPG